MGSLRKLMSLGVALVALSWGGTANQADDGGGADTSSPGDAQGDESPHPDGAHSGASCLGNSGSCEKNGDACQGVNAGQASCGAGLFCCQDEGVPPTVADAATGCETANYC